MPSFLLSLKIFLKFSDFEPRIILKILLNTKVVPSPTNLRNVYLYLLMFYEAENELIFCIDNGEVHLKAVF